MCERTARQTIANAMLAEDPVFFDLLTADERRDTADAILAALAAAGIKCLEREPSGEMVAAANNPKNADWDEIWYPMWDAAGTEFADG